jgi:hypothetical protein
MDRALRVRPEERTQTIADLRADLGLGGGAAGQAARVLNPAVPALDRAAAVSSPDFDPLASAAPVSARPAARAAEPAQAPSHSPSSSRMPAAPAASGGKGLWIGVGAAVLLLAGVGGFMLMSPKPAEPPPVAVAPAPAPVAPAASPAPAPAPVAPAPPPVRFDALEQFDKVMAGQAPGFDVVAVSSRPQLRIGRDKLSFTVKSSRDGYVNVLLLGPDGSLLHFFPNTQATDNRIRAGQVLTLPQANWILDTAEPAGAEYFLVIVSEHPRDFSVLSKQREYYFLELPTGDTATALLAGWPHATPMLLGALSPKATCQGDGCNAYGAARFTVEVVN